MQEFLSFNHKFPVLWFELEKQCFNDTCPVSGTLLSLHFRIRSRRGSRFISHPLDYLSFPFWLQRHFDFMLNTFIYGQVSILFYWLICSFLYFYYCGWGVYLDIWLGKSFTSLSYVWPWYLCIFIPLNKC